MSQHNDDDPVIFGYESSYNISFRGEEESGYTWGEWRKMTDSQKNAALDEHVWTLVDLYVKDEDEDD